MAKNCFKSKNLERFEMAEMKESMMLPAKSMVLLARE